MSLSYNHAVYRAYTALARHEHFTESELGDTFQLLANGKQESSDVLLTQLNYEESEEIVKAIESIWKKSYDEIFNAQVFTSPGKIANRIISAKIRTKFDIKNVPQFDKNGNLNIPRWCDFIVPKRNEHLITGFIFYRINKAGIVKLKQN